MGWRHRSITELCLLLPKAARDAPSTALFSSPAARADCDCIRAGVSAHLRAERVKQVPGTLQEALCCHHSRYQRAAVSELLPAQHGPSCCSALEHSPGWEGTVPLVPGKPDLSTPNLQLQLLGGHQRLSPALGDADFWQTSRAR